MDTLPDYLTTGLNMVFVGLNPGLTSVRDGHYFASPRNRFWRAANSAGIFDPPLKAETDHMALEQGIGFTDVVKRPSAGASDLRAADFREWAPVLKDKLERYAPSVVCFHGSVAYKNYLKHAEGVNLRPELGPQQRPIGASTVFLVPNPSPANAAYSIDDLVGWYYQLGLLLKETTPNDD
ncbi:MAG: mismatch-specific DNA-glycosylase [SAR202 cluster bacterium]|nr:mismatch-specific DNA-glycosylase [SAR202 cluster bacterium]MDP6512302.1 mismatch-specific DNA-glycosylase [SAR202 cluster bacterium]MDP6716280.1 mismatch-specific DNA-glycosylase [SAR202 cluster bacterium]